MNREIKFRAWNGSEMVTPPKVFIGSGSSAEIIEIALDGRVLTRNAYGLDAFGSKNPAFDEPIEDIILMQYTGLKDKNGKECFEGDIVKMYKHDNYTHKHEVSKIWKEGKYHDEILEVKFIHSSFVVWSELTKSHRAFMYMARPGESFEIIGNIHENPELLS